MYSYYYTINKCILSINKIYIKLNVYFQIFLELLSGEILRISKMEIVMNSLFVIFGDYLIHHSPVGSYQ